MVEVLKRLAGPAVLAKKSAGTSLYTPGSGVVAGVRNALLTSMAPWDAYVDLALNDFTTPNNILVSSLYVPAFKSVMVPLDVVLSNAANDSIVGRQRLAYQDAVGTAARIGNPSVPANGTGSTGSASSVATGSWASTGNGLYLLCVAWSNSTGAGTIASFTDAHTGVTWTQTGPTITSADGNTKLAFYTANSSGAGSAVTTVTFSGTQDQGACVAVVGVGTSVFDDSLANGQEAACWIGGAEDARNTANPQLYIPEQSHCMRVYAVVQQGGNGLTTGASTQNTERSDTSNSIANGLTLETASILGNSSTNPSVIKPTWSAATGVVTSLCGAVEFYEKVSPVHIVLNGVEVS